MLIRPWVALWLAWGVPLAAVADPPAITVVAGGDLLFDRGVRRWSEKAGVRNLLADLRPQFRASDLALANLECPLTTRLSPMPKQYVFRCDPAVAEDLRWAGLDVVSLANNHSIDQGRDGLLDTIQAVEAAGLVAVGAGGSQPEARRHHVMKVGEFRVAILGYVAIPIEGVVFLEDRPGPAQLQEESIVSDLAAARVDTDLVIVNIHWGSEFHPQPSPEQQRVGRLFIDGGATMVIGHHPHVLQPTERYKGGLIAYSLGNLVFDQRREDGRTTALLRCQVKPGQVGPCAALPLEISKARPHRAPAEMAERIGAILGLPLIP
jgi:poly-gamma-glutamate capsule biosynthesis protein CapA/YwtB (metallophosphatase superfamily)